MPAEETIQSDALTADAVYAAVSPRVTMCRNDSAAFAAYVLRNEENGEPIRMTKMHYEWHDIIAAYDRMVLWCFVDAGKTQQISIAYVIWYLGTNPNARVLIFSGTDDIAKKIAKSIADYIEKSPQVREVFPNLLPDFKRGWSSSSGLFVQRSLNVKAKDPSVRTAGYSTNFQGARADLVIFDDFLTYENTATAATRAASSKRARAKVIGRLSRKAKVLVIGNAWFPDDMMHDLAKVWPAFRYGVENDNGLTWPEHWDAERIAQARIDLGELEATRQLDSISREAFDAKFKQDYIVTALQRGDGRKPSHALEFVPRGYSIYTGVDLAVGDEFKARNKPGDKTSLVTIAVHPNEDREVLNVEQSSHWGGPEIVDAIIDVHSRYGGIFIVESNAAQRFILQFTRHRSAVPVVPFNTGKNKSDPRFGIETLTVEMANAKWIFPNIGGATTSGIAALVRALAQYRPGEHTHDALMAMWFAREGARQSTNKPKAGGRTVNTTRR